MKALRNAIATILILALLAGVAAVLCFYLGVYNVAATHPHSQLAYSVLQRAALYSIRRRAQDISVPDLSQPAAVARGLDIFRQECVRCHGAPGVAPEEFALGLEPAAPPLAQTAREWRLEDMFWAIRHGIKMTAMPAWQYRLTDDDIWAIVAFLRILPTLSPADYRALVEREAGKPATRGEEPAPQAGDPDRGRIALHQYACNMCHEISGISGPPALAGPPLREMAQRPYIAGVLVN
jgi:mono/diheme cytochrome c family protein